jgi:integrase
MNTILNHILLEIMNRKTHSYSLFNRDGQRKYLTSSERRKFHQAASEQETEKKLFFFMLFYSGARISEVLNLSVSSIDISEGIVVIESLKKRRRGVYRIVPIPEGFIVLLSDYIQSRGVEQYLWNYSRRTASRYIKYLMDEVGINGVQASAKGLRHGFAICAIENNVPLNLIKRWMGHSSITTTEIYLEAVGQEERKFAKRMW